MTHFPRVPMTMQYPDLVKSSLAGSPMTDNRITEDLPEGTRDNQTVYRTPPDRVNGNEVFRRLPNGMVDMPSAISLVVSALSNLKFGHALNDLECCMLCACYPSVMESYLPHMNPNMVKMEIRSKLRVSDEEIAQIAMGASIRLMELHEWLVYAIRV